MVDELTGKVVYEINNYMRTNNISRKEFSKKAGISYFSLNNMISKLNKKESFPTIATLKKIEKVLKNLD